MTDETTGIGAYDAAEAPEIRAPRAATKKEFLKLPENAKLKKSINTSAIICYICAALTLAVGLFLSDSGLWVLIDVIILLAMGLGIHLRQSRVCAIILCVYAAANAIIGLINNGKFSGYLVILAGVYALIGTMQLESQWKAYRQEP